MNKQPNNIQSTRKGILVSIIVPCYNGADYLRETLDCLKEQTITNWECIIVNDGSTDNSLEIMKEYASKDNRYKFIDKKNEGVAIARNTAIAASSGIYILPLDADDKIAPSYAEKAILYLKNHPETKLVYCNAEYFGDKKGSWVLPDYSYDRLLWGNSIFCSAIYKRKDFEKTSGYNSELKHGLEDWDFWLSFLDKNDQVYKIPEVLFYYRRHGETRNKEAETNYKILLNQIIQRHLNKYNPYLADMHISYSKYKELELQMNTILNSPTFRIGKVLLSPIKFLKSIFIHDKFEH